MSADSLYDNLSSYLRLTSRVVSQVGGQINVGEEFTLKFTGTNAAYQANTGQPAIVFDKARVYVQGTEFARPLTPGWHDLPDKELLPGQSSSVEVKFQAIKDFDYFEDIFGIEHVARAWLYGDLDQNRFFRIWTYIDVNQEIVET